jgi:dihydroneopterin aldolase
VTDRIILKGMRFDGHHGVSAEERAVPQPFEVDVELLANLQPAGVADDLAQTADYSQVYRICRELVESTSFRLLEAMAEGIAHEVLTSMAVEEVGVRVRKMRPPLPGPLDFAGVEIWRTRTGAQRPRRWGRAGER